MEGSKLMRLVNKTQNLVFLLLNSKFYIRYSTFIYTSYMPDLLS